MFHTFVFRSTENAKHAALKYCWTVDTAIRLKPLPAH